MDTLFPLAPLAPSGFCYTAAFISSAEEDFLLRELALLKLHPLVFRGYEAKRKVESFGYDYSFDDRRISPGKAIPHCFGFLIDRCAAALERPAEDFKEVLVSEYPVGSVINWHRDAPPFDLIVGISLAADCDFKFRPYEKNNRSRSAVRTVKVTRRSMYVLSGEARTEWEHSIAPVKALRYSITLRTLRQ